MPATCDERSSSPHRTEPIPTRGLAPSSWTNRVRWWVRAHITESASPTPRSLALDEARDQARGSTLYVTLEPCSHQGETPPCAGAVVEAGVRKVVIGAIDPDHGCREPGSSWLKEAGSRWRPGCWQDEAEAVDPAYFHHRRTGLPLVTLKTAMTLDGSVAATDGSSQWITSEEARLDAHRLRGDHGCRGRRCRDLPRRRPFAHRPRRRASKRQPVPVVVAGRQSLPIERQIWERSPLVISAATARRPAGEVVVVGGDEEWPDPVKSAQALADRGLLDVLLEGGPQLAGAWWRAGVVEQGRDLCRAANGRGTRHGSDRGRFRDHGTIKRCEYQRRSDGWA